MESIENPEKKFDLKVTYRKEYHDREGRKQLKVWHDPYIMRQHKGTQLFERPVGSHNLFYADGEPAGRWDPKDPERWKPEAKHVEWTPPKVAEEKDPSVVAQKDAKIRALEMELASIRREKEAEVGGNDELKKRPAGTNI